MVPLQHVTVPTQQSALSRFDPERIATKATETGHVSLLSGANESVEGNESEERNRTYPWHHAVEWDSTSLAQTQLDVDLPGAGEAEANDIFGVLSATQDNLVMAVRPDGLVLDARGRLLSWYGDVLKRDRSSPTSGLRVAEYSRTSLYELRREDTSGLCRYAASVGDRSRPVIICHSAVRNTFTRNRELLGA